MNSKYFLVVFKVVLTKDLLLFIHFKTVPTFFVFLSFNQGFFPNFFWILAGLTLAWFLVEMTTLEDWKMRIEEMRVSEDVDVNITVAKVFDYPHKNKHKTMTEIRMKDNRKFKNFTNTTRSP